MYIKTDSLGHHELIDNHDLGSWWSKIKSVAKSPYTAVKYSITVPYRATKSYLTHKQLKGASDLTRFY